MSAADGPGFRCAVAALVRGDDLAGTATHVNGFVLVEHDGPWGRTALRDAALPDEVRAHLASARGLKVLLVRRHHRAGRVGAGRVFACVPRRGLMLRRNLTSREELLDVDLAAIGRGEVPAGDWVPHREPVYAVCTHGRHDACCAEQGRPVATALAALRPEQTWEVSHLGGDRFAGNVLVLPQGLYYGRVTPADALGLVEAHEAGRFDLDRLRGRSSRPMPLQHAEIALRRHLGEDHRGALRLVARDGLASEWQHGDAVWRVRLTRVTGAPERLTCGAAGPSPVPAYAVEELARLS